MARAAGILASLPNGCEGIGDTFEVCVEEYADAPEGMPTWCVEQDISLEALLQLGLEAILLLVIFWTSWFYFRHRRRKKRELENLEIVRRG